jgi:pimeloyl-ACP methyl ester carboxylesterase
MSLPGPIHTVLVPGLLCSERLYAPVLPALWTHGPTTVADTRRDDSLADIAERLLASIVGPFALVGLSMGGYIALDVVRQAPERVRALALLSTSARPDTPEQSATRRQQIELVRAGSFDQLVEAAFPLTVDAANADDEQLLSNWREMADEVGPDAFVRQQDAIIKRADSRPLLPTITCPTLVVHGAGDQLIDPDNGRELATRIPDAHLELLDQCGHSPTLERPHATASALTSLLSAA